MLEFGTRDRINGEVERILPNSRKVLPRRIGGRNSVAQLILETLDEEAGIDHPVCVKSFKYKKKFKPLLTATNPSMPKVHASHDQDFVRHEVSQQQEQDMAAESMLDQARRFQGRFCKRVFSEDGADVELVDDQGVRVMYDIVFNDMVDLEGELAKIGSYFIRKHEHIIDPELKEPNPALDRGEVVAQLLEMEQQFQMAKVKVIEQFMEGYEHCVDLNEQQRFIQIVVDLMARRPRLNFQSTYFVDAYKAEVECLGLQHKLLREVIDSQISVEKAANKKVQDHLELKYRLINEHMQGKWKYSEPKTAPKPQEQQAESEEQSEEEAKGDDKKGKDKEERLAKIAQRHITDYTNNNYDMDFADVLGLPEITAYDLFKNSQKSEPLSGSVRQQARFNKIEDGYPKALHLKT